MMAVINCDCESEVTISNVAVPVTYLPYTSKSMQSPEQQRNHGAKLKSLGSSAFKMVKIIQDGQDTILNTDKYR